MTASAKLFYQAVYSRMQFSVCSREFDAQVVDHFVVS